MDIGDRSGDEVRRPPASAAGAGSGAEASSATPEITRRSVRRNAGDMMTSQLTTWVLATATAFVIPRFLGPASLGDLRLAGSLWMIAATVAALGTSQFLQLEIARDQAHGLRLVGPTVVLRSVAFVAAAAVLAVYIGTSGASEQFALIFALVGLTIGLGLWSEAISAAFVGLERMSTAAIASVANRLLYFLAVLGVFLAGGGVVGLLLAGLVTTVVAMTYPVARFRREVGLSVRTSVGQMRRIAADSRTYMAAGVALVAYQQVDMVVISWVAEREDLGWYGAADTLFGSLLFPATVLIGVLFPTMGRLHASDPAALDALLVRTFSLLLLVAVPIGVGTTIVGPEFAPLLYGEDFAETGQVLEILGPVVILTFGTILFGATALATERGRIWVGVLAISVALTIPLDLLLVPWANERYGNGALGGAIAYLVTEGLQFAFGLFVVGRVLLTRSVLWRSARIGLAGGVMLVVGVALRPAPMPVTMVASGATYLALIVVLRTLGDDERGILRDGLARVGIGGR